MVPDEVCANDTKTYATECHMRVQSCNSRTTLRVEKKGPCGTCFIRNFGGDIYQNVKFIRDYVDLLSLSISVRTILVLNQ